MNTVESRPVTAALLAKAALKRLVQSGLEPTPENYARAWAQECGSTPPRASAAASAAAPVAAPDAAARGQVWASLIERLVAGVERGGRQWTQGRRKDSLQRVLQGSRSDGERLLQRLQALVQAWQADKPADASDHAAPDERAAAPSAAGSPTSGDTRADAAGARGAARADPAQVVAAQLVSAHEAPHDRSARRAMGTLAQALGSALPAGDARAGELADRLSRLADRLAAEGANDVLVLELDRICADARRWFGHRHQLVEQLGGLCRELTRGLTELAEDDSWARGQCAGLEARLAEGLSLRALRAASQLLDETRRHQQRLRGERSAARDALKQLLARMLSEVGELGQHAGVFELAVQGHAEAIARAESVESLAGVVQAMLEDSRTVRASIGASRARLHEQQARAGELEERVRARNPVLFAEEARLKAAEKSRELAYRNRYPDFTVGFGPIQYQNAVKEWELMVELNIPLQLSTRRAQERESEAMLSAARARKEATANQVLADLAENLAAIEAARRVEMLATTSLLPQAELTFRAALAGYENGKVDFATLLEAQRQIRQARQSQIKAQSEAQIRLAAIERLLGEDL